MNLEQTNDLHERAMSLAEAAIVARTEGDEATAHGRFHEALDRPHRRQPASAP
jgi:hypothetical protein